MSSPQRTLTVHDSWLPRLLALLFFVTLVVAALAIFIFMSVLFATLVIYADDHIPARPVSSHSGAATPEAIVARVNGTPITEAELNQELTVLGSSAHARSPKLAAEVRRSALDELIVRELIFQEAKKKGVRVLPAEIERELARVRKRFGSSTTFHQSLASANKDDGTLRREIERRLVIEKVTARELQARVSVSEAELQGIYRANRARFRKPEEVRLRTILAALGPAPKPAEVAAARQKIERVSQELKRGGVFPVLAQKYSGDAYRAQGGLVGWVHRGRFDPEVEKVAFALAVGQVSAPFQTKYGFLILKLEGKHPARQLRYVDVRDQLRAELKQQRMGEAREAWVSALKKNATIEIPPTKPS